MKPRRIMRFRWDMVFVPQLFILLLIFHQPFIHYSNSSNQLRGSMWAQICRWRLLNCDTEPLDALQHKLSLILKPSEDNLWAMTSSYWIRCFVESDSLIFMLILISALFTDWGRTLTRRQSVKRSTLHSEWMKSQKRRELLLICTFDQ